MQHNHHYLLWLYIQGYGSHSFRRLVRDLVSTVANATNIDAVLRSHEYAKVQRIVSEVG